MALNALTLSVTQGVQGRPFLSAVSGLTTGRVEVLVDGAPGFSFVNGTVFHPSLPYSVSTVVLREYEPGVGAGFRDSRIDITAATNDSLRDQALAALSAGRSLRNWRVGSTRQSDGSYVYSLFVEDDLGATGAQVVTGGGSPAIPPTNGNFVVFWDSRGDLPNNTGLSATAGLTNSRLIQGQQSWLGPLSEQRLQEIEFGNYAISSTTSTEWRTNPRTGPNGIITTGYPVHSTGTDNKGTDFLMSEPDVGIVVLGDATNDTGDINTTLSNLLALIEIMRQRFIVVMFNGTPRDVGPDGSTAPSPVSNGAARFLLKQMIDKLDCESGDPAAIPGVYVADSWGAFVDEDNPNPCRNIPGVLSTDRLHENGYGAFLRAQSVINRLERTPWFAALPKRLVKPTAHGLTTQGGVVGAQAPYINRNPVMLPGNAGSMVTGSVDANGSLTPILGQICEDFRVFNNNTGYAITPTKGIKNANGDWIQRLQFNGSMPAGQTTQFRYEWAVTSAFMNGEVSASRLSLDDWLYMYCEIYIAPGAQGLLSAGINNYLQMDATPRGQISSTFAKPGVQYSWSNASGLDPGGIWLPLQSQPIKPSNPLFATQSAYGSGTAPGLPASFGNNTMSLQVEIGLTSSTASQPINIDLSIANFGLRRVQQT